MEFLQKVLLGNTVLDYISTFFLIVILIIVVFVVKTYAFSRLVKKAEKTKNKFDDLLVNVLGKTLIPALYFGVIYMGLEQLHLNTSFEKAADIAGIVIFTFLGIKFLLSIISYALMNYWLVKFGDDDKAKSVKSVMPILKAAIYGVGIFFLLDNLGFKISTLIAGLGIGGVAVALAGQAILADLFSYFSILFDRPFELGDFVIVGDHLGTIEHIGIKTTRIRSLSGEQLVLSNSDLTGSRVKNYKRMQERRIAFKLGVIYQTKPEQLREIPKTIKNIIEGIKDTKFDRSHFQAYGDFSLNFETVYYIYGADYNKYMDIQQEINLKIFEEFAKHNIEFAYPTQTLFMENSSQENIR